MLILALAISILGLAFSIDKVFDYLMDRRKRKQLRNRVRWMKW